MSIRGTLDDIGIDFDQHDRWGSAIEIAFAAAHALDHGGRALPAAWGFQDSTLCGGLTLEEDYNEVAITEAVSEGRLSWDDVTILGSYMMKLAKALEANGEAY